MQQLLCIVLGSNFCIKLKQKHGVIVHGIFWGEKSVTEKQTVFYMCSFLDCYLVFSKTANTTYVTNRTCTHLNGMSQVNVLPLTGDRVWTELRGHSYICLACLSSLPGPFSQSLAAFCFTYSQQDISRSFQRQWSVHAKVRMSEFHVPLLLVIRRSDTCCSLGCISLLGDVGSKWPSLKRTLWWCHCCCGW